MQDLVARLDSLLEHPRDHGYYRLLYDAFGRGFYSKQSDEPLRLWISPDITSLCLQAYIQKKGNFLVNSAEDADILIASAVSRIEINRIWPMKIVATPQEIYNAYIDFSPVLRPKSACTRRDSSSLLPKIEKVLDLIRQPDLEHSQLAIDEYQKLTARESQHILEDVGYDYESSFLMYGRYFDPRTNRSPFCLASLFAIISFSLYGSRGYSLRRFMISIDERLPVVPCIRGYTYLKHLKIDVDRGDSDITFQVIGSIADCLGDLPVLNSLTIDGSNLIQIKSIKGFVAPQLTSLQLLDCNLASLDGLEVFSGLQWISLKGNSQIRDLSPLGPSLPSLLELDISGTGIEDIGILTEATRLGKLVVGDLNGDKKTRMAQHIGNSIQSNAVLATVEELRDMHECQRRPLSVDFFQQLPFAVQGVNELVINGSLDLIDLDVLSSLVNLRELTILGCPNLRCIKSVSFLVSLESLRIERCNALEDLGPIQSLNHLASFSLRNCDRIESVRSVQYLQSIRNVILSDCLSLVDLPSEWPSSLIGLWIDGCPVRALGKLPYSVKLVGRKPTTEASTILLDSIRLDREVVDDPAFLGYSSESLVLDLTGCPMLQSLMGVGRCCDSQVIRISSPLIEFSQFELHDNVLVEYDMLGSCRFPHSIAEGLASVQLRKLTIVSSQGQHKDAVHDLGSLSALQSLFSLDISGLTVTNIDWLQALHDLEELRVQPRSALSKRLGGCTFIGRAKLAKMRVRLRSGI